MLVIGITGGFGTGKSTVSKIYEEAGYKVYSTDEMAKNIIQNDRLVRNELIKAFGDKVFDTNDTLNVKYLSPLVFDNDTTDNLEKLNRIVHPAVIGEMIKITESNEKKNEKIIFFESALIFEANLEEGFDYIITVTSDLSQIIKRTEGKLNEQQVLNRIKNQISNEEKAGNSDFVIENNSSLSDLRKSAELILAVLTGLLNEN
jgi:dephospho-CoA kinase